MQLALDVVSAARAAKNTYGVNNHRMDSGVVVAGPGELASKLSGLDGSIKRLVRTERVDIGSKEDSDSLAWTNLELESGHSLKVGVDLSGMVDAEAELNKRSKKLVKLSKDLEKLRKVRLDKEGAEERVEDDLVSLGEAIAKCRTETEFLQRISDRDISDDDDFKTREI